MENLQKPVLIELTVDWKDDFLEMANEYKSAGEDRYQEAIDDFEAYLERLRIFAANENLPANYVPSTTYFLLSDGKLIGRGDLRHRLNEMLKVYGGHIGYDVRPSERRKGYGSLILQLTLEKSAEDRAGKSFFNVRHRQHCISQNH